MCSGKLFNLFMFFGRVHKTFDCECQNTIAICMYFVYVQETLWCICVWFCFYVSEIYLIVIKIVEMRLCEIEKRCAKLIRHVF